MPRYYLDYLDGEHDQIDVLGHEFEDDEMARSAGRQMLAERVCVDILRGGEETVCVRVRREGSTRMLGTTISVTEELQKLDS